jgi:hypothetical protein
MSEPINNGGPALPLRDYLATHAPDAPAWWWWQQGMSQNASVADMARWNYVWADAMLAAREAK